MALPLFVGYVAITNFVARARDRIETIPWLGSTGFEATQSSNRKSRRGNRMRVNLNFIETAVPETCVPSHESLQIAHTLCGPYMTSLDWLPTVYENCGVKQSIKS